MNDEIDKVFRSLSKDELIQGLIDCGLGDSRYEVPTHVRLASENELLQQKNHKWNIKKKLLINPNRLVETISESDIAIFDSLSQKLDAKIFNELYEYLFGEYTEFMEVYAFEILEKVPEKFKKYKDKWSEEGYFFNESWTIQTVDFVGDGYDGKQIIPVADFFFKFNYEM